MQCGRKEGQTMKEEDCFICHFSKPIHEDPIVDREARVVGVLLAAYKNSQESVARSLCERHLRLVCAYGLVDGSVKVVSGGCGNPDCPNCGTKIEHASYPDKHVS